MSLHDFLRNTFENESKAKDMLTTLHENNYCTLDQVAQLNEDAFDALNISSFGLQLKLEQGIRTLNKSLNPNKKQNNHKEIIDSDQKEIETLNNTITQLKDDTITKEKEYQQTLDAFKVETGHLKRKIAIYNGHQNCIIHWIYIN